MKRSFLISQILLFTSIALYAQPQANFESGISENNKGEVIFIRDTGMDGWNFNYKVFLNDELVCRINNRRFSKHLLQEGSHSFAVQFWGKKLKANKLIKNLEVQSGKTHFLLLVQKRGFFRNELVAVEISEADAMRYLENLKEDEKY